jgi:hypothetical protein
MSRQSSAPQTIAFLESTGGADWEAIADHFGITRVAVAARIRAARTYLITHAVDKCIPHPTPGTDWRYKVTNTMYAQADETSVAGGAVLDFQMMSAISDRLVNDFYVAFDAIPTQQRRTADSRGIRSMIGALENVSTVCNQHQRALRKALSKV